MRHYILPLTILITFVFTTSCNTSERGFENKISTSEEGLSAKKVYVTSDDKQLSENVFFYGQKIHTNFENLDGFSVEDGTYFPQMSIEVTTTDGKRVMFNDNLLDSNKGYNVLQKVLYGQLILATPMQSGEKYIAKHYINDTKGGGEFSSEMYFTIKPNPRIMVKESGLQAKEVYIFNQNTKLVIADGKVEPKENLQFQFEGLQGFELENGLISLGLSINVFDAKGKKIVTNSDAFENTMITTAQLAQGIGGTLVFSEGLINNPVTWEVEIWDKNGNSRIKAGTELEVD
ncbi:hypothetical protein MTsPCn9_27150 [Croceitalea sp. MTPC9]|uniref:hypothetical protein n=1 Tax=unclassified Croceitalea TaxID=2632280 RepID=UPI002B3AE85C|nr:hypothetical protein MTsPCn6_23030 [Croceitalea sp. MTPC6]GMN17777.1 hypothetical protein MTsPCn9_27150 [Croceitalea sp. MTPC9]